MDALVFIAIAPVIFLLKFIREKDPHPESSKLLKKIFTFGCLTVIPVLACEIGYGHFFELDTVLYGDFGLLANVFLGVGLIEEFFKWLVIYIICYKNRDFDESYDAIVYAAYSSLGFACVENVFYVFLQGGLAVGIARAITAVPGHLCYGVIMGYFFGKARANKAAGQNDMGNLFLALLIPTILHTIYDFLLEIEDDGSSILIWIVFTIICFVIGFILVKSSSKNNQSFGDATPQTTPIAKPGDNWVNPNQPIIPASQPAQPAAPAISPSPTPTQTPTSVSQAQSSPFITPTPTQPITTAPPLNPTTPSPIAQPTTPIQQPIATPVTTTQPSAAPQPVATPPTPTPPQPPVTPQPLA